ncbi:HI1506-related protein [Chitinibacter sp. S2-10]|uniref:HI1506-related protein n=1 Tax=Chitinibacter sp. S2-10 TaxID=3373597 RepID=UPI0039772F21
MIRITAKQDGFRRAGLAHSASPTDYPNDHFSKEQLLALQAEPMLIVEVIKDSNSDTQGDQQMGGDASQTTDVTAQPKPAAAKATAAKKAAQ